MKTSSRSGSGISVWLVVGWVLLVVVGIGLAWYGFMWSEREQPVAVQPSPTSTQETAPPTVTPPPSPTASNTPAPTDTPLPTATPEPTALPATATATLPPPMILVGDGGVNVRSGPGTNYTRQGSLDPGAQAEVTGRHDDWWQIRYDDDLAWVFGDLITASNVDDVPQVEPPPAPTAAPTAASGPTAVPPAATAAPVTDIRGLAPDKFEVEGAPGPYTVGQEIRFHMWITNNSGKTIEYNALGTWVAETGQFQKSYFATPPFYPSFVPGQQFQHSDCITIPDPGTYNLWMAIHFKDGTPALLKGPVLVTVQ